MFQQGILLRHDREIGEKCLEWGGTEIIDGIRRHLPRIVIIGIDQRFLSANDSH